jgi:hypothetical protein
MKISDFIIPYSELTIEKARAGCFVTGMPNEDYHSYEGVSNTGLKLVGRSPAHYAFAEPYKQTDANRLGSAFHCAILEPELFANKYLLLPEAKDRRVSIFNQAAKSTDKDFILVEKEISYIEGMRDAFLRNEDVQEIMSCEYWTELSGFIQCPKTGVLLRIRFDVLNERGQALDPKKTTDAREVEFSKSIFNYGYHHQAAMYSEVYQLITGEPLAEFGLYAAEDRAPYESAVYVPDEYAMELGKQEYLNNLANYAECEKTGIWHGYQARKKTISLPPWALFQEQDEIIGEIV